MQIHKVLSIKFLRRRKEKTKRSKNIVQVSTLRHLVHRAWYVPIVTMK